MSVIAFVCVGATGHIYPSLPLVRELVDRGESVVYLAPERCRAMVESAGATCAPYPSNLDGGTPRQPDYFDVGDIPAKVAWACVHATPHILRGLETIAPDVLVYDAFTYAGMLAGEVLGLPMIRWNTTFALSDKLNHYIDPAPGRLRGTLASPESLRLFDGMMPLFFQSYGLRPRSFHELLRQPAELEIVRVSRAFHPFAEEYDPNVVFVGHTSSPTARPASAIDLDRRGKRFLIYISLGTVCSYQPAFYYSCLEAFAKVDARVVMAVGKGFPADYWVGVPDNFVIQPFVPQLEILTQADLFITHGGMGSVLESLDQGAPMLVVPQQREQMLSALRVEELGAGLFLDRLEVSILALRQAGERLLADPSYRQRALALGESGRRDGGYRRACDCIQDFLKRRSRKAPAPDLAVEDLERAQQLLRNMGQLSDNQVDALLNSLLAKKPADGRTPT